MNWLKKVAQITDPADIIMGDPADIIMGVIENRYDGSGPSVTQPAGGGAYKELKKLGPLPEVCQMINEAAGINPAARPKMQVLAEATGCPWTPQNPVIDQQQQQQQQPDMNPEMPMMGEQEKPMNMPTVEFE